jgi:hypothetical protein
MCFIKSFRHSRWHPSSDDYTVKVAKEPEDIKGLLEIGFEYICEKEGQAFLRKRK